MFSECLDSAEKHHLHVYVFSFSFFFLFFLFKFEKHMNVRVTDLPMGPVQYYAQYPLPFWKCKFCTEMWHISGSCALLIRPTNLFFQQLFH